MDFGVLTEALANLSWREALIAIIALLVLYVLVVFLRMRRLKRSKTVVSIVEPLVAQAAVAAYTASASPSPALSPEPPEPTAAPAPDFAWNEPPPEIPGQQLIDALERHVYQLRGEVGMLRTELQQLREEVQREVTQAQATHNVSPLYSDAMQMAMQGHDATAISQHCGIARAEAELVVALVRNRNDGN
jgi:hypothetical protein